MTEKGKVPVFGWEATALARMVVAFASVFRKHDFAKRNTPIEINDSLDLSSQRQIKSNDQTTYFNN